MHSNIKRNDNKPKIRIIAQDFTIATNAQTCMESRPRVLNSHAEEEEACKCNVIIA